MRLVLAILAVIAGMYAIDKFLADQERKEIRQDAHRRYEEGERLLVGGKPREAVVSFSRAHSLDRSNREYQIALASAEMAAGKSETASATLDELLQDDSNDARANLLMARVMAARRQFTQADSYYHRAIYGAWPPNSGRERANVRLELAGMLAKNSSKQELLSELLQIQNDLPASDQIAAMFLQAGSAARAADAYRALIRIDPTDSEAFTGLAQAEMLRGNYNAARSAYRAARRIHPGDPSLGKEEEMVDRLAALDPTSRRLASVEKYNRSREILRLVQEELAACSPRPAPAAASQPPPKIITNELSETLLENAERLWSARSESCKQPPEPFDPLPVLMNKLVQSS